MLVILDSVKCILIDDQKTGLQHEQHVLCPHYSLTNNVKDLTIFDWPDINGVIEKLGEELGELREEIDRKAGHAALEDEAGDLLFAAVNLLRHAGVDPETALRRASDKFAWRFRQVELRCLDSGKAVRDVDADVLDWHWNEVKRQEDTRFTD